MLGRHLAKLGVRPEPYLRILERTGIERRHTVLGEDLVDRELTFAETNDLYIEHCIEIGEKVAREAIAASGLAPQDIDSIITTSCTGYMIPSLDAYLMERLALHRNLKRTPITELGCVAGAVALSRAREQLVAYPRSRILIVSVELPSLTYQPRDSIPAQLISSLIFSDGAAAVVLSNGEGSKPSPRLLGSRTYTVPGSLGDMGYSLDGSGLHIVLSPDVPNLIRDSLEREVEGLLAEHGFAREDLRWFAMHPAGPKVLRLVQESLRLTEVDLASSWKILRDYGNSSSAAVLLVMDELIASGTPEPGQLGLLVAFGPGVTGELLLARWEG